MAKNCKNGKHYYFFNINFKSKLSEKVSAMFRTIYLNNCT